MRLVQFEIPRGSPEETVTLLRALLDALVQQNLLLAQRIGFMPDPYTSNVRYQQEDDPGVEHFDHFGVCMERGWGDCDDLVGWRTAQLIWHGEKASTRVIWPQGQRRYHARVRRADGSEEDPSIVLRRMNGGPHVR